METSVDAVVVKPNTPLAQVLEANAGSFVPRYLLEHKFATDFRFLPPSFSQKYSVIEFKKKDWQNLQIGKRSGRLISLCERKGKVCRPIAFLYDRGIGKRRLYSIPSRLGNEWRPSEILVRLPEDLPEEYSDCENIEWEGKWLVRAPISGDNPKARRAFDREWEQLLKGLRRTSFTNVASRMFYYSLGAIAFSLVVHRVWNFMGGTLSVTKDAEVLQILISFPIKQSN